MPTYDFKCENGHVFEMFLKQFYDEKDTIYCPTCFSASKRIFSKNHSGFILNGTGWAKDNYGNKIKPKEKK